jgi:hypothetical protein
MFEILSKITSSTIGFLEPIEFKENKLIAKGKTFDDFEKQKYKIAYEEEIIIFETPLEREKVYWEKELLLKGPDDTKYIALVRKIEGKTVFLDLQEYSDKRRFLRIKIDKEMDVRVVKGQKIQKIYALVDNLSYGGVGFIAGMDLDRGTEVILKLHLQTVLPLKGMVVHKKDSDDGFDFYYGIQFDDLTKRKGDLLFTYLERQLID